MAGGDARAAAGGVGPGVPHTDVGDTDAGGRDAGVPEDDLAVVSRQLGRSPAGRFEVVVRSLDGRPAVIANAPFLTDGTPMPTRFWLTDPVVRDVVSRLESDGGVRKAEDAVPAAAIADAHARYAAARDALIPTSHVGPRPTGGVGGTRRGVKCLHAHVAWWLAGGDDPVGQWAADQLGLTRTAPPP
jgi:uncharacterized protein